MNKARFQTWETALLLALAAVLLWGAWTAHRQDDLAQKMIRLHVIANSDSQEDQALKLQVRDKVLLQATTILEESDNMTQAMRILNGSLPEIEHIATQEIRAQGYDYGVTASLENTEFPTKEYDGFRLPSGEYLALRVVIGDGAGKNWWCVVFPPLCTTAATDLEDTAIAAGWENEDVSLVTEQDGYVLKFRAVELWENFRQWLGK